MGRSQVLYNRTKGRFRNKVRNNQSEQHPNPSSANDQHPRGYHVPPKEEAVDANHDSFENAQKKRSRSRSSIGQHTTMNESEMMLLASSAAPQYYIEDDSSSIFGGGSITRGNIKVADSLAISSSSLNISSLETTLMTCVSLSDRLKLPSHVAQTLQKEGSPIVTTKSSSKIGLSQDVSPVQTTMGSNYLQGGEEKDSEEIIRKARIRKQLLGESPTKSSVAPSYVASSEFTEGATIQDDSFLASFTVYDEDEVSEDVIRPSYSGIKERGRVNLPAAPSLVYKAHDLKVLALSKNKKEMDDASISIGPNKIKATEQGDIEVRMKKTGTGGDDDASRMSREFDVDRYAVISEDDEDSLMTSDQSDSRHRLPSGPSMSSYANNNRNRVAAVSARAIGPAGGKRDPPTTTLDPPTNDIPPLKTDPSDDSDMLENWLDDVVADTASSAAVHPMDTSKKSPPISTLQMTTAASQATTMPKEVTIPTRPAVGVHANSTVTASAPSATNAEEEAEDTLESWLDDVIM